MSNTDAFESIPRDLLVRATGGMRYTEDDRMSDNVEDRRGEVWDPSKETSSPTTLEPMPKYEPAPDILPGPRDD